MPHWTRTTRPRFHLAPRCSQVRTSVEVHRRSAARSASTARSASIQSTVSSSRRAQPPQSAVFEGSGLGRAGREPRDVHPQHARVDRQVGAEPARRERPAAPSSSRHSRTTAAASASPASTRPPGSSHRPATADGRVRWAASTRPSRTMRGGDDDRLGGQRRDPRRQFLRAGDEQAAHARAEQERIDGPAARRGPAHLVVHLGERTVGREADDVLQLPERAAAAATTRYPPGDTAVTTVRSGTRIPARHERVDADLVAAHEERAVGREPMALTTQRRRDHPCVAEDPRDRAGQASSRIREQTTGTARSVAGRPDRLAVTRCRTRVTLTGLHAVTADCVAATRRRRRCTTRRRGNARLTVVECGTRGRGSAGVGQRISSRAPPEGVAPAVAVPPRPCTNAATRARPRPDPPPASGRRRVNRSNTRSRSASRDARAVVLDQQPHPPSRGQHHHPHHRAARSRRPLSIRLSSTSATSDGVAATTAGVGATSSTTGAVGRRRGQLGASERGPRPRRPGRRRPRAGAVPASARASASRSSSSEDSRTASAATARRVSSAICGIGVGDGDLGLRADRRDRRPQLVRRVAGEPLQAGGGLVAAGQQAVELLGRGRAARRAPAGTGSRSPGGSAAAAARIRSTGRSAARVPSHAAPPTTSAAPSAPGRTRPRPARSAWCRR